VVEIPGKENPAVGLMYAALNKSGS